MVSLVRVLPVVLLTFLFAACGADDEAPDPAGDAADTTAAEQARPRPAAGFEVALTGTRTDTLQGVARFGPVWNRERDRIEFVFVLETPGTDALLVTRRDTVQPAPGTFALADSAGGEAYELIYQQGLQRRMLSSDGQLTFEHVSDTLIVATFEATLHPQDDIRDDARSLQARGIMRARPGRVGYFVGL